MSDIALMVDVNMVTKDQLKWLNERYAYAVKVRDYQQEYFDKNKDRESEIDLWYAEGIVDALKEVYHVLAGHMIPQWETM